MPISIWAGVECTINRVGDLYLDQCRKSGHDQRLSDIALFASLGIERLRYPFLWETATRDGKSFEWNEFAERLREMERVGLVPIAGLLHHGSGPSFTSLIENNFIENFVDYATQFARRFPWVEDYTPINEPLTTARFSGLYGIWYPHKHSDAVFVRALFQQIKATVLAMRCVREVNPRARLIQTEDLGRAQGTEKLQYQVHFENERRWLSFDLLCGKVDSHHYLYKYLIDSGLTERELKWLLENSMPPDILGINHYLLSNRFLDQRLELYPECFHGGNGQDRYADVGAVDFPYSEAPLAEKVFLEAWQRYHLPMAVTEIHMHGFRESQMRWFKEIRAAAENLQQQGVDMRAITAWSLLGSFDWNSLCTNCLDYYESGVFDIRANKPRPTALVPMIKSYVDNKEFQHPLLEQEGWWRKSSPISAGKVASSKSILITGATGTLGQTFRRICQQRHLSCQVLTRQEMDIADFAAVEKAISEIKPWAVINTAGYVRVDLAESEPEKCFRENVAGPENLARICADKKIPLVTFSSDFVFDGSGNSPYLEDHPVSPINVYGQSKAESEKIIFHNYSDALVVRTSSFFGPWDEHNFLTNVLRSLIQGQAVDVANDMTMSPTYLPDLVNTCLDLLIDGVYGLLHLTNSGQVSWAEFATMAATAANSKGLALLDYRLIRPCATSDLKLVAKRPSYSALSTEKARILPSLEDAIDRYFYDLKIPIFNHVVGGEL